MSTQIAAVNRVEAALPALRELGKFSRLSFTDAIQKLNEYVDAEGEGASRPDLAYANFTRTIYAPFGLNKAQREALMRGEKGRDIFSLSDLRYLQIAEETAGQIIEEGIAAKATRKAIKSMVKNECGRIAQQQRKAHSGYFSGMAND